MSADIFVRVFFSIATLAFGSATISLAWVSMQIDFSWIGVVALFWLWLGVLVFGVSTGVCLAALTFPTEKS